MAREPKAQPTQLRIRKYPNRRYYDSTRSRHLTLEEIYNLIRKGYQIQVTDSQTGTDITAKVLAQIIIELDAPKLAVFPIGMLHRLLQSNERIVGDFVQQYFNQPLSNFLDSQRNVEQYVRRTIGIKSNAPTVADWAKLMLVPVNPTAPVGSAGSSPVQDLWHLIAELRQEVKQLRRASSRGARGARGAESNSSNAIASRQRAPADDRPRPSRARRRKGPVAADNAKRKQSP